MTPEDEQRLARIDRRLAFIGASTNVAQSAFAALLAYKVVEKVWNGGAWAHGIALAVFFVWGWLLNREFNRC
jgi:hypothetical protein